MARASQGRGPPLHRSRALIFVTVGTQLPFDRMVGAVDLWAAQNGEEVFAQTGPTSREFPHIRHESFLDPIAFDQHFSDARLIIAHAGMGSILSALAYGKPIVIIPRKAASGEHRNDHQLATARRFEGHEGIYVVWSEDGLGETISKLLLSNIDKQDNPIYDKAPEEFISGLKTLINQ